MNRSSCWSDWYVAMQQWVKEIKNKGDVDAATIEQLGTIIPDALFASLSTNVQSLCKQINASYENNLFDCTAIIMRRLLESLLVLS